MEFLKKAISTIKNISPSLWIAAVILPGGFLVLGTYVLVKGSKNEERKQENSHQSDSL